MLSRLLFEWWGILIPPHSCEMCGGRHWTYSAAVSCFWNTLESFIAKQEVEFTSAP